MFRSDRKIRFLFRLLCGILLLLTFTPAAQARAASDPSSEGAVDVSGIIFDHVTDAHSWHICTIGGHHVTVPLPVIVYSPFSGWHAFMSSRLSHGASYEGLTLPETGPDAAKIVETAPDGSSYRLLDFSITKNVIAVFFSILLLLVIFILTARQYTRRQGKAPSGMQNALETVILFLRDDVAIPAIGKEKYERYMPYLLTVFFFILTNNLLGLFPFFPGGANVTGNITVTMTLAVFTFLLTNLKGNKAYWKDIFNTPGVPVWLKLPVPIMPLVEFIGIFTKPVVLMIRLFANITAGHIIMLGFFSLIFIFGTMHTALGYTVAPFSIAFTIFMTCLELLVAFIQAYIFTLLSAIYFGFSVAEEQE